MVSASSSCVLYCIKNAKKQRNGIANKALRHNARKRFQGNYKFLLHTLRRIAYH